LDARLPVACCTESELMLPEYDGAASLFDALALMLLEFS
jgi:hypothetical protein